MSTIERSWKALLFTCVVAATPAAGSDFPEPTAQPKKPAATAEQPDEEEIEAGEGVPPGRRRLGSRLANLGKRTLGGVQLWDDLLLFQKWRIQEHALFGYCRLLDGNDERHARGTYDECLARLDEIKRERKLPPMKGKAVVVVHGLGGWRATMQSLADYIEKNGEYTVFNVGYASTRGDIATHALHLASVVEHLDGIEELNFVAHSLGNIVVRRYLGDANDEKAGRKPDPRIKRFVMISPPNHGAAAAEAWSDNDLFELALGESAKELGTGWPEVEKTLATPSCQFGIIAGGKGDDRGYNPALEGDNDGLLSVSTTKLVGARDFVLLPVLHPLSPKNATVQEYTLRFLQKGYFISADERHPITAEDPPKREPSPKDDG
jgi:pimeloyl-ACP methyl ester carboxylesterase